jgi:uncharacterized protein (DUF58 family)
MTAFPQAAAFVPPAQQDDDDDDADASLLSPEIVGRLGRLAIMARRMATARKNGRRRTRRIGSGVETIDLRPYDIGDDTRRIAWHAYARLERLLVKLVADEAPLRLTLVVDQSASMQYGSPTTKLRQAARIAAGFAAVALGGEDRVALAAGSEGSVTAQRAVTGRAGLPRVLATLDQLAPRGKTDLQAAVRAALDAAGPSVRGGMCILLSDLYEQEGVLAGAKEARRRGLDVAIIEVLAPFELSPPDLSGFDLEDEETGEIIELPERDLAERYQEALQKHREAIDEAARGIDAAVVRTTTDEPFETIVTRALTAGLLSGGAR